MEHTISAREWGQEQARSSPPWSEEKWRRIGSIFGVDFLADQPATEPDEPSPEAA